MAEGENSLAELHVEIEREMSDLMRFKQRVGGVDVYLYADRIARRKEILQEIAKQSSLDETYVEKILNTPQTFLYSTGCTLSYSLMHKHTSDIFSIQQNLSYYFSRL